MKKPHWLASLVVLIALVIMMIPATAFAGGPPAPPVYESCQHVTYTYGFATYIGHGKYSVYMERPGHWTSLVLTYGQIHVTNALTKERDTTPQFTGNGKKVIGVNAIVAPWDNFFRPWSLG